MPLITGVAADSGGANPPFFLNLMVEDHGAGKTVEAKISEIGREKGISVEVVLLSAAEPTWTLGLRAWPDGAVRSDYNGVLQIRRMVVEGLRNNSLMDENLANAIMSKGLPEQYCKCYGISATKQK